MDLPGYGYAAVGQKERDEFNQSVSDYLAKRKNIFCVFALIDSRLEPQRIDLQFVQWLGGCAVPFVLVFTKTDKQSTAKSESNIALFKQCMAEWWDDPPQIFTSSAKTKKGRAAILGFIEQTLADHNRAT